MEDLTCFDCQGFFRDPRFEAQVLINTSKGRKTGDPKTGYLKKKFSFMLLIKKMFVLSQMNYINLATKKSIINNGKNSKILKKKLLEFIKILN